MNAYFSYSATLSLVTTAAGTISLPTAVQPVRHSGRLIGEVLAAAVNFYNPSVIVIGGDVADAQEQLLASIRESSTNAPSPSPPATSASSAAPSRIAPASSAPPP